MTTPRGLTRIPLHMLEQVLGLLERGRLEFPVTAGDLVDAGFHGRSTDVAEALAGVDRAGAEAALRVAIAERVYRPPPRLELVWTGPETRASIARSTALVVERLFNEATRCVIIGGYRFDTKEILEPLCRAMTERGVTVMIFVDIDGATPNPADADAFATAFIDKWLRDVWPRGVTKPEVYYDPRTAIRGDVPGYDWATLHAKCVVVDDEKSFITSANFTDRGQTRNIEAGVLITDTAFSEHLAGHWRQLVSAGLVRRYAG